MLPARIHMQLVRFGLALGQYLIQSLQGPKEIILISHIQVDPLLVQLLCSGKKNGIVQLACGFSRIDDFLQHIPHGANEQSRGMTAYLAVQLGM
ncbi:hypothetical protein D3C80_1979390 [compost metagenome]